MFSYAVRSSGQHIKDATYSALTGQKPERDNVEDALRFGKLGQTYVGKDGTQKTVSSQLAKDKNKIAAESIGQNTVDKMTRPIINGALSTKNGTRGYSKPNVRPRNWIRR